MANTEHISTDNDERSLRSFIGTAVVAGIVFFILHFIDDALLEGKTTFFAFLDSLWKAAVFGLVFHFVHNPIARLFRWYK